MAAEITIGLHETFAENNPPALFQMASHAGYDFVELLAPRGPASGLDPVAWPSEAEARASVQEVRRLSEESGVRTDSFYGGGFWVLRDEDQPERARRDVDFFSLLIPMLTQECGSRAIVLNLAGALVAPGAAYQDLDCNGSGIGTDIHYQRAAEALHALGEVAGRAGSVIGVEMHGCSLADTGASTLKLIQMANHPAVGVTWDTGNLITMGRAESWEQQLTLLAPHIVHVHLKNGLYGKNKWRRASLEGGAMEDVADQILALRSTGYAGALVVEAPGLRENQSAMAETDLRFLQRAISRQKLKC